MILKLEFDALTDVIRCLAVTLLVGAARCSKAVECLNLIPSKSTHHHITPPAPMSSTITTTAHSQPKRYIYKIVPTSAAPPTPLPAALPVSALDQHSQYIHASTSAQLLGTLTAFFAAESQVYILRIPYDRVEGVVRWEDSAGLEADDPKACWDATVDGGAGMFPHLYNGLKVGRDEVDEVRVWEKSERGWSADGWPFGSVDVPAS